MLTATPISTVHDTINRSFTPGPDGFWYPRQDGTPLVRILVDNAFYQVERRRRAGVGWMAIVTALHSEFDPTAFGTWVNHWSLVAA